MKPCDVTLADMTKWGTCPICGRQMREVREFNEQGVMINLEVSCLHVG